MRLFEDIIIHDTLNPKLFDLNTAKLLPEVRNKIIGVVSEFEENCDLPIEICDIQIVGSNASFNWHDGSDLDVHIITNFEDMGDEKLVASYLDAKKTKFNNDYDIYINGVQVELYIQDVKAGITSNGIYSVCDDAWVKEPKPIKSIKHHDNAEVLEKWKAKIDEVVKSKDVDDIQGCINMLYLMRHNSIAVDGEYGKGNQLFKDIRNLGLLDDLKKALLDAKSKQLSLEGMHRGKVASRYED